ncbi:MAG TPA: FmdB family zinc ribbon protein [Spirochaetota bacterium]
MPTYDYKCDKCGDTFEIFQSMNDEPLSICEKCGGSIRRLFSAAGIIFKGSGFYVNDYKKGSSSKSSGACSGCASGSSCDSKD